MRVSVKYRFVPKRVSCDAAVVMDCFGVGMERGEHVIAEDVEIPVRRGDVVIFVGPSGSGKSSLLRAVAEEIERGRFDERTEESSECAASERGRGKCNVVDVGTLKLPKGMLVEGLCGLFRRSDVQKLLKPRDENGQEEHGEERDVKEAMELLSGCGLGEARLMLRTPEELSDGQRWRYRLAAAIAGGADWLMVDEFTASLDRKLAKVMSYNMRRLARRYGTGFLLATTHEDVLSDLDADVVVRCALAGEVEVKRRGEGAIGGEKELKKNGRVLRGGCGSVAAPKPTGRISLGGIIGDTVWVS